MAPSATDLGFRYDQPSGKGYEKHIQKEPLLSSNGCEYIHNAAEDGRVLAKNTLRHRVESIDTDACEAGQEDAFFVADMGEVYRQHLRWKLKLPRVKPHYGMFPLSKSLEELMLTVQKL